MSLSNIAIDDGVVSTKFFRDHTVKSVSSTGAASEEQDSVAVMGVAR